jgi:hypothetical protein
MMATMHPRSATFTPPHGPKLRGVIISAVLVFYTLRRRERRAPRSGAVMNLMHSS